MSLDRVIDLLRRNGPNLADLDARIKFLVEGEGPVLLDATTAPPSIAREDGAADCTIELSPETLEQLLTGTLSPTWAYTTGRLKIEGSLGVALKFASKLDS
ncbi:MAG TPA: SCP2 sterol-binding domain-containing protein [Geminicoccaceae bacterium]|nr:SCP2 sterol-binding domain-containing protein [Geminicoccaceae bacterium]